MRSASFTSQVGAWLADLPIEDPVQRRLAALLQIILIGLIVILFSATILNVFFLPIAGISWQSIVARGVMACVIAGAPLLLLRRGSFGSAVLVLIAILLFVEAYVLIVAALGEHAETLIFFTLAIFLAGLLKGRSAMVFAFAFSVAIALFSALRDQDDTLRLASLAIVGNFTLLNGLMALFIDQFGVTLRLALNDARASEAQYRMLIEESPTGILINSADEDDYRIVAINPAGCQILGYARDALIGMNVSRLIDPDDLTRQPISSLEEMQSGNTIRRERIIIRRDGARISVLGSFKQMPDRRLLYIFQDITERKRSEEQLQQSEARYRAVVENQTEFIVRWKPDGTRTFVNEAYCRYFGLEPQQALGTSFFPLIAEDDRVAMDERIARVMSGGTEIETYVDQIIKPDGSHGWQEWTDQAIQDENGQVVEFQSVGRDITERKLADEELRRSEEKFRQLITSAPDAIIGANQEGKIMFASTEATKLLGYELEELMSMNIDMLMPERFWAAHTARYASYMTNPHPRMRAGLELFARRKDGSEVPVDINLSRLDTEAGPLVTAFIRDITERKQAEAELQESEEHYRHLAQATVEGIAIGADGIFIDANPQCAQMFGYTLDELLGMPIHHVVPPEDKEKLAQILNSGQEDITEQRIIRKDGIMLIAEVHSLPTVYKGQAARVAAVHDITERKQAEVALQQYADRLELLHEIDRAILAAHTPAETALAAVVGLRRLILVPRASVSLFDFQTRQFTILALSQDGPTNWDIATPLSFEDYGIEIIDRLQHSQSVVQQDVLAQVSPTKLDQVLASEGFRSWLLTPLFYQGALIGSVHLGAATASMFTSENIEIVRDVADQLAVAIQQNRLLEATQKQVRELTVLHAVAQAGVNAVNEKALLERVIEIIGDTLYPDLFNIFLLDEATQILRASAYGGVSEEEQITVISLDQGIVGAVAKSGQTRRVPDVHQDSAYLRIIPSIQSELCVPIKSGERVLGVINVESKHLNAFSEADERLLATIAGQLSNALQRQRSESALRQRANQMSTLYNMGLAISTNLAMEQILNEILKSTLQLVNDPQDAHIFLYSPEEDRLTFGAALLANGQAGQLVSPPRQNGLTYQVARTGRVIVAPDIQHHPIYEGAPPEWKGSIIGLPLRLGERVVGVMNMACAKPRDFSENELQLLRLVATHAATAIENAKLYQEARQAAGRRAVLHRISQDIVRFSEDFEQIYAAIHEAAGKLMTCDVFIIALRDELRQENVMVYAVETGQRYEVTRMPANHGFSGTVINEGKSLILKNSEQIEKPQFTHFGSPRHVQSALAVPMRIGDKVIGMTSAQCYQPYAYDTEEQSLLEMLSTHAATAIENARLFEAEQLRRIEAETLRESLASIVTTFKLEEVLERILDQIKFVIPYDTASVWRVDGEWLKPIIGRDIPEEVNLAKMKLYVDGDNSSHALIHGEKPFILNNNVQEELKDFKGPHSYINSWLAVPLKNRGRIIGQISLDGKSKAQFTLHHAELAVTFADQVAIALENASLFELEQLRRQEAETLRESLAIVAATLEQSDAIDRILEQLERVVPYNSASVQLLQDGCLEIVGGRRLPDMSHLHMRFAIVASEPSYPVLRGDLAYVLYDDVQRHTSAFDEHPHDQIHAWLAVPLKVKGDVIGIIALDGYQAGQFSERHAQLAVTYADQVTIALENARLYTEVQQLNANLEHRVQERTTQLQVANQELIQEKARLEQYAREAEVLSSLNDLLQASLTTNEASQVVSRHIQRLFPGKSGGLYLNGHSGLEATLIWGDRPELDMIFSPDDCWALRRGRVYAWGPAQVGPSCQHLGKHQPQASLCLPLLAQGDTLGTLHLQTNSADEVSKFLDDSHLRLAETVANNLALALANLRLRETLRRQSIIDSMTGLYNHRYMEEMLTREIHRARRHQHTLSVLMFDVDNFKKFNDTFGHDAGDFVLRKLGELIQTSTRTGDIACHPHGEEFTLILPETEIEAARQRAERLRSDAEHMTAHYNGQALGNITLSIGVAAFPQHGDSWQAVLKAADDASYEAKNAGKNRVAVAPTLGQT